MLQLELMLGLGLEFVTNKLTLKTKKRRLIRHVSSEVIS